MPIRKKPPRSALPVRASLAPHPLAEKAPPSVQAEHPALSSPTPPKPARTLAQAAHDTPREGEAAALPQPGARKAVPERAPQAGTKAGEATRTGAHTPGLPEPRMPRCRASYPYYRKSEPPAFGASDPGP